MSTVFGAVMTLRTPAEAARVLLETAERHPDDVLIGVRGRPVRIPARARDAAFREALWRRTEDLTGSVVSAPRR
ncbi:MAG TPA: hypothetical protein VEZ42_11140 [Pseudonocardia sp.]|nr:hypothetical protein [Pseudonocardia sp.]